MRIICKVTKHSTIFTKLKCYAKREFVTFTHLIRNVNIYKNYPFFKKNMSPNPPYLSKLNRNLKKYVLLQSLTDETNLKSGEKKMRKHPDCNPESYS